MTIQRTNALAGIQLPPDEAKTRARRVESRAPYRVPDRKAIFVVHHECALMVDGIEFFRAGSIYNKCLGARRCPLLGLHLGFDRMAAAELMVAWRLRA
jgi:hypothetical protein